MWAMHWTHNLWQDFCEEKAWSRTRGCSVHSVRSWANTNKDQMCQAGVLLAIICKFSFSSWLCSYKHTCMKQGASSMGEVGVSTKLHKRRVINFNNIANIEYSRGLIEGVSKQTFLLTKATDLIVSTSHFLPKTTVGMPLLQAPP